MNPILVQSVRNVQRNILAGIITAGPLFITWIVFGIVLGWLAEAGLPLVHLLNLIFPAHWLTNPWIQPVLAILLTLVVLYLLGRVTSQVIGRQAWALFESTLDRLPFVAKVYNSVRQLLDTMMSKHDESSQRVVLVDFPLPGHKCIGFLTRTMIDSTTGMQLAAVLLPNAINPTSAILQVLPLNRVTETDLTMEQAMSLLMTGGAVGPDTLLFTGASEGSSVMPCDAAADGIAINPE